MLLDICLGTRTSWKILFVLSEAPGKGVSRTEIRRLTRLGNKVITKFTSLLEQGELISSSKVGKTRYYKLNLSNPFTIQVLEMIRLEKKNLNNPDFEALNIVREFTYELTNLAQDNLRRVILFGSYAKGTQTDNSDLDIAIIVNQRNSDSEILITDAISRISKRFNKEIQPHYFSSGEFEKSKNKNKLVHEILKDGIVIL